MLLAAGEMTTSVSTVAACSDVDDQRRPVHVPFGRLAIDLDRDRFEAVAVEPERAVVIAIAFDLQCRPDDGPLGIEREVERDVGHQPVGRAIILAADGGVLRRNRGFGIGIAGGQ